MESHGSTSLIIYTDSAACLAPAETLILATSRTAALLDLIYLIDATSLPALCPMREQAGDPMWTRLHRQELILLLGKSSQRPEWTFASCWKHLGLAGLKCDDERLNETLAALSQERGRSQGGYSEQQLAHMYFSDPCGSDSEGPCRVRFRRSKKKKLETQQARFSLVVWSTAPRVRGTC